MQKLTVILFTLLFACQSTQEKPVVNTWDCEVFPPEHRIETDSVSGAKIIYATTDTSKDLNFYFDLNSWTADLRLLAFFSNRTGQNELFGYLAPTGEIVRLQSPAQPVAFNATVDYQSPDIYVVRENQIFQWHLDISLATADDQRSSVKISEYFIAKAPEGRSFFMGLTESGDGKFLSAGLNRTDSDLQDIVSIEIETGKITTLYTAKHISHVQFNKYNPNLLRFSHWPQRMWYIDVRQPGKAFPLHHQEAGELVTHEDWWVNDQMTFCGGNRPEHAHLKVVDLHTQVTRIIGAGSWWEGGTPRELSRYNWWHCSGAPDGRWVATDNWHGHIAISDARTAHLRLLTTDHRTYGNVGVEHPHVGWAPDSKSVEFTSHKLGNANVCLAFLPEAWENPFQQVPEPSVAAQQE